MKLMALVVVVITVLVAIMPLRERKKMSTMTISS